MSAAQLQATGEVYDLAARTVGLITRLLAVHSAGWVAVWDVRYEHTQKRQTRNLQQVGMHMVWTDLRARLNLSLRPSPLQVMHPGMQP